MHRKKFKIRIRAYGYKANFTIEAEDSIESVESAILDKIGQNAIMWEADGFYDNRKCYLTYEEVTDGSRQHGVVR